MKKLTQLSATSVLFVSMASSLSALELEPALELNEVMPRYFATVVTVQNEDKPELQIKYAGDGIAWTPASLNAVLNAYGKELSPENAENVPSWFAQAHEVVGEDGKVRNEFKFGTSAYAWYASSLHQVMGSYGLKLPVDNLESLPSGYARVEETVRDGETVSELKFGSDGVLWTGQALAQVLLAYQ